MKSGKGNTDVICLREDCNNNEQMTCKLAVVILQPVVDGEGTEVLIRCNDFAS